MSAYHFALTVLCALGLVRSAHGIQSRIVVFPVEYRAWDTHGSSGCAGAPSSASTDSMLVGRCADIDLYSVQFTPHPPPCTPDSLSLLRARDLKIVLSGYLRRDLLECHRLSRWTVCRSGVEERSRKPMYSAAVARKSAGYDGEVGDDPMRISLTRRYSLR